MDQEIKFLLKMAPDELKSAIGSMMTYETSIKIKQDFSLNEAQNSSMSTIIVALILGLIEIEYLPIEIQKKLTLDEEKSQKISSLIINNIYNGIRIEIIKFKLRTSEINIGQTVNQMGQNITEDTEQIQEVSPDGVKSQMKNEKEYAKGSSLPYPSLKTAENYTTENKIIDLDSI